MSLLHSHYVCSSRSHIFFYSNFRGHLLHAIKLLLLSHVALHTDLIIVNLLGQFHLPGLVSLVHVLEASLVLFLPLLKGFASLPILLHPRKNGVCSFLQEILVLARIYTAPHQTFRVHKNYMVEVILLSHFLWQLQRAETRSTSLSTLLSGSRPTMIHSWTCLERSTAWPKVLHLRIFDGVVELVLNYEISGSLHHGVPCSSSTYLFL